jgi:hypothetical protein
MSEFTDDTLDRYLDQQPGMRRALLNDPVQCAQTEVLRRTLVALERAMVDEGVDEEARRRVVNRVVWGDPDGLRDTHAEMRDRVAELHRKHPWTSPSYGAGPVRPDEEPTP